MTQFTTTIGRIAHRLVILAIPLLVAATGTVAAHSGGSYGGGMMGSYGMTSGWWPFIGMLTPVVFLLVLLGGGYWIFSNITESGSSRDSAMEELRAAYGRGDITDDEFETRRNRLDRSE